MDPAKKMERANGETLEIQVINRHNTSAASPVFVGLLANLNTEGRFTADCSIMQFSTRKQQSVTCISVKHNKVVVLLPSQ